MNIIKEIDNLLGKITDEIEEDDAEFELNIWTNKEKAQKFKNKLIDDADKYGLNAHTKFDNEHWISIQIGSLDVGIWHN